LSGNAAIAREVRENLLLVREAERPGRSGAGHAAGAAAKRPPRRCAEGGPL